MADGATTVIVEDDAPAPTTPVDTGDTVIVSGGDDTESLVAIAGTLGQVVERLTAVEARLSETQFTADMAASTADAAIQVAAEAGDQADAAADVAIEAAVDAAEAATENDMPPEREHWFFKPPPWKRNRE